jgi:hypothetical protein
VSAWRLSLTAPRRTGVAAHAPCELRCGADSTTLVCLVIETNRPCPLPAIVANYRLRQPAGVSTDARILNAPRRKQSPRGGGNA